jgi:DNA-binding MarR family transcriptional regulator
MSAVSDEPLVLARFLPYRFSILAERISRAFGARYGAAFGLGIPEWRVMAVLGELNRCSTKEIIARTEMDPVKVSRAAGRLVDLGLVQQKPHPEDKRAQMLNLTRKGGDVYGKILPMARALEAEFTSVLDAEERRALDVILTKLHVSAGRLQETS